MFNLQNFSIFILVVYEIIQLMCLIIESDLNTRAAYLAYIILLAPVLYFLITL